MQRLVYSPKAYAFIYSSNLKKIINVSADIVSGNVTRRTNDPSSARLVLRNKETANAPNGKYVRQGNAQVFMPNDLITIWLQRVAGKPIQVFTGYLDTVPMFEMYPRAIELTATCTLKKLAYGWFDPGLEFFSNWMNTVGAADGWVYNPTTGEATSPLLNLNIDDASGNANNQPGEHTIKSMDGGFARLLHEFMTGIAGWPKERMHISNLDPDLPNKAAALYKRVAEAQISNQARLAVAMREMMGVSLVANKDGVTPVGTLEPEIMQGLRVLQQVSTNSGIPLKFLVFAAIHQTAFEPSYSHGPETGNLFGYGLFKRKPDGIDLSVLDPNSSDTAALMAGATIRGNTLSEMVNPKVAATVFAADARDALNSIYPPSQSLGGSATIAGAQKRLLKAVEEGKADETQKLFDQYLLQFGAAAQQSSTDLARFSHDLVVADTYVRSITTGQPVAQPNVTDEAVYKTLTWDSDELKDVLEPDELAMVRDHYSKNLVELVPYLYLAKNEYPELKLFWDSSVRKEEIILKYAGTEKPDADNSPAYKFFKRFGKQDEVENITLYDARWNGRITQYAFHKGESATVVAAPQGVVNAQAGLSVEVKKGASAPDFFDQPVDYDAAVEEQQGLQEGFTFEDLGKFTANAALAAKYAFPVNYIESHFMTGQRSLQNDIPVMDGVKQFCQASLRSYMSLPDGSFLAFYPDYFGAKRKPYWWIPDIEIVDMRIQLNDYNLATHVYVTGDTFNRNDSIEEWDRILTRGVVTIHDVALVAGMMDPGNPAISLDPQAFLNHYGARPIAEENPLIRNHFYEFLMAWQRFMQLWATQFATEVQFTFQPEVLAGGLLGFKDHHLQMYVEEVTHDFAYDDSGFNTHATLSAPSRVVPPGQARTPDQFPGMIPAGAANTVGAA